MAGASIALTLVSSALSAYSTIQQGKAERDAMRYSAKVNETNAQTASIEAAYNEDVARRQLRQRLSRQSVAQGEAGIAGNTFADRSYMQSVESGSADILNLRYKGLAEAENYRNQAALNRFSGASAYNNARLGAYTQLVGGAANALSMYSYYYGERTGDGGDEDA